MKTKKLFTCLLAVILCASIALTVACGKPKEPDDKEPKWIASNWTTMPENTNKNLKYFGYFHSDGFQTQGSYIDEIKSLQNANVVMINSAFSVADAQAKLAEAKAANMKVIFTTHGFFENGVTGTANSATLATNYKEVWSQIKAGIDTYITDGTIISFYFDEPSWNGVKEEDFRTVTKMLREACPNVKVMTTMTTNDLGITKKENYPEINATVNEYCTDVMYDSYVNWNDATRREYLTKLKSKALQNQSIWGCATGFSKNPEQPAEMIAAIKGMYTEAIQEPRYAGIISFSYADGIAADWGYGLHSFFNNTSDYYNKELKKLYINIGREVIGLEAYDFSKDIDLMLVAPQEVYELGETIELPAAGATDGNGNVLDITYEITSPSNKKLPAEAFVAKESGNYTVNVSAKVQEQTVSKTANIAVRYPDEISLFDDTAYLSDADGNDADFWCWSRQIDKTFSHSGEGSLKITPHAKDGTWPRIIFGRNGFKQWDLSKADYVSMWVYNASDTDIKGFSLVISNENIDGDFNDYTTVDLPAKTWTLIQKSIAEVKTRKPTLDLTKASIFYGNSASDYKNRGIFYIDDVTIVTNSANESYESEKSLGYVTGTADDKWTWPTTISAEQHHTGAKSLKITPHATDGTWPNMVFSSGVRVYFDLTDKDIISVWVYNSSAAIMKGMGLKVNNGEGVNQAIKTFDLPSKTWTEISITKTEILALASAINLKEARISFLNAASDYKDRSNIYLDDFTITVAEKDVSDGNSITFEKPRDIDKIGANAEDIWTWPTTISAEQHHTGEKSLKITTRQDGGVWPNVVFKYKNLDTFDLTNLDKISLWVYFDSANAVTTLGFKIKNQTGDAKAEKTFNIASKTWTEITFSKAEIVALSTTLDLSKSIISFSQLGGTYEDRANFYLDDFAVIVKQS